MTQILGTLLSLAALGIGVKLLARSIRLRRRGKFAVGSISHIERQARGCRIHVTFTTTRNTKHKIAVFAGMNALSLNPGDAIAVLYDPKNPTDAIIYTWDFLWSLPLSFLCFGILMLGGTLYSAAFSP